MTAGPMSRPPPPDDHAASRADLSDRYVAAEADPPALVVWSGVAVPGLLEPGDRRIRAVVRPRFRTPHSRTAHWTCTRCGAPHRITVTWAAVLRDLHTSVPRTAMVCPPCADLLMPYRFHVDAQRASDLPRGTVTARAAIDLVERVERARGPGDDQPLCIRSADVVELARDLDLDRAHLAQDLLDLGLLVATSRGTDPVVAGRPGA